MPSRPWSPPAPSEPLDHDLLLFFKAMADETRLRIIGLLSLREHTVEQLAGALAMSASTISHHLARLDGVGLVSARTESYYRLYRLETQALSKAAQAVLSTARTAPAPAADGPLFDQKVLRTYLDPDGRIRSLPSHQRKRLVILRHVAESFERGRRYPEKAVNEILKRFSLEHHVTIRRYLVDHGLLDRQGGGGAYWRPD